MNEVKGKTSIPNIFMGCPVSKKSRIFSPTNTMHQKIIICDKKLSNAYPYTTSSSLDEHAFEKMLLSNPPEKIDCQKNEPKIEQTSNNNNIMIIDVQDEYDEVQEILNLFQPKEPNKNETKQKGIKALIELKKAKIEIIPEEDEDKKPIESKNSLPKEKDNNQRFNIHLSQNINQTQSQQLRPMKIPNTNFLKPKQSLIPRQTYLQAQSQLNNQDLIQDALEFRASNINYKKRQLNIFHKKNNSQNEVFTTNLINPINERKVIKNIISPNIQKLPIVHDEIIESPSTSEFTIDSMKKQININNSNNNSTEEINKEFAIGFKTQKMKGIRQMNMHNNHNNELDKFQNRPLSNPHSSNSIIKEVEYIFGKQNNNEGLLHDYGNKREFSQQQTENKKRVLMGSAPSQSNFVNERFLCKNNSFNNKNLNIRPLHKIKIERGLVSSQLIEKFSKKISREFYAQAYSKGNLPFTKQKDLMKAIKL